jgi:hypothetical protein
MKSVYINTRCEVGLNNLDVKHPASQSRIDLPDAVADALIAKGAASETVQPTAAEVTAGNNAVEVRVGFLDPDAAITEAELDAYIGEGANDQFAKPSVYLNG